MQLFSVFHRAIKSKIYSIHATRWTSMTMIKSISHAKVLFSRDGNHVQHGARNQHSKRERERENCMVDNKFVALSIFHLFYCHFNMYTSKVVLVSDYCCYYHNHRDGWVTSMCAQNGIAPSLIVYYVCAPCAQASSKCAQFAIQCAKRLWLWLNI